MAHGRYDHGQFFPFCAGGQERDEGGGNADAGSDGGRVCYEAVGAEVEEEEGADEGGDGEDDGVGYHFGSMAGGSVCGSGLGVWCMDDTTVVDFYKSTLYNNGSKVGVYST